MDNYNLTVILDQGSSTVYLATPKNSNVRSVWKLVKKSASHLTSRIDEEFRIVTYLHTLSDDRRHQVIEYFELDLIECTIRMEYIEGEDLSAVFYAHQDRSDDKSLSFIRDMAHQTLQILDFLHTAGVAHRDIKDENLMVKPSGQLHLIDFGHACFVEPTLIPIGSYRSVCQVLGTLGFMAPEVRQGLRRLSDWYLADVYSFGIIVLNFLTRCDTWSDRDIEEHTWVESIPPDLVDSNLIKVVIYATQDLKHRMTAQELLPYAK